MTATIKINMDNAAFEDNGKLELAAILKELANFCTHDLNVDAVEGKRTLLDSNGNTCGAFSLK